MAADRKKTAERLRTLAETLRAKDAEAQNDRVKTAAHVLRASKGLTILRDKVRA